MNFKEISTNSLRYWEKKRLIYNVALAILTLVNVLESGWIQNGGLNSFWGFFVFVLVLAVIANFLYCVIYPIDVFIQFSEFRDSWLQWRWTFLVFGTIFACILAEVCLTPGGWLLVPLDLDP